MVVSDLALRPDLSLKPPFPYKDSECAKLGVKELRLFHIKNNLPNTKHKMEKGGFIYLAAETFAEEIISATEKILQDENKKTNLIKWCEDYPPIAPLEYFQTE